MRRAGGGRLRKYRACGCDWQFAYAGLEARFSQLQSDDSDVVLLAEGAGGVGNLFGGLGGELGETLEAEQAVGLRARLGHAIGDEHHAIPGLHHSFDRRINLVGHDAERQRGRGGQLDAGEIGRDVPGVGEGVRAVGTDAHRACGGEAELALVDKRRPRADVIEVMNLIGDVAGRDVIIFDDIISTGGTLVRAAQAIKDKGAQRIFAACTHAVFGDNVGERIQNSVLEELAVTNTIHRPPQDLPPKVRTLSVGSLLGEAIRRIH